MRGFRRFAVLSVLAAACHAPAGPAGPIRDLPWGDSPADEATLQARQLVDQGRAREALELVEGVLAADPRHVDALRVRQDVLRERGRRGLLVGEAQRALRENGDDAVMLYLAGRLAPTDDRKLELFGRAAELAPSSLWPWLGLADTLRHRDPARALAIYRQLDGATSGHPLVAIALAAMLRETRQHEQAVEVYERLRGDPRVPGVGDLGLAQSMLALDRRGDAWTSLMATLRQRLSKSWTDTPTELYTAPTTRSFRQRIQRRRPKRRLRRTFDISTMCENSARPRNFSSAMQTAYSMSSTGTSMALSPNQRRTDSPGRLTGGPHPYLLAAAGETAESLKRAKQYKRTRYSYAPPMPRRTRKRTKRR
jgi:hypothetical protein